MNFFKKNFLWFIFLATLIFWGYNYLNRWRPCKSPIAYSISSFDERFLINKQDFLKDVEQASMIWGNVLGKDLFIYDQNKGKLKINLIYDNRQEQFDKNKILKSKVNDTIKSADSIKKSLIL